MKKEKGQSVVETAIILPVLLLILTGIIDFGMLLSDYMLIVNASREGARYAAVGYSDTRIEEIVGGLTGTLDSSKMTISVYPAESLRKKGDEVEVKICYDHSLFTPLVNLFLPDPINLQSKTVMRVE